MLKLAMVFRSFVSTVFSYEALFVVALYSGSFKSDPRLGWVPFDLTALLFALCLGATLVVLTKSMRSMSVKQILPLVMGTLFVSWSVVTSLWSPIQGYASNKTIFFGTLGLFVFWASSLVISGSRQRFHRFCVSLLLLSIPFLIGALLYQRPYEGAPMFVFGSTYLGLGRILSLGLLIGTFYCLFSPLRVPVRIAGLCGLYSVFGLALMISGARGPLVFAIVCCLLLFIIALWILPEKQVVVASLLTIGAALYVFSTLNPSNNVTITRFQTLSSEQNNSSALVRAEMYQEAIFLANKSQTPLVGNGIGSWPVYSMHDENYTHNLLLEIITELGLIGLLLFMAFMGFALYCFWKSRARERYLWLALALNLFLNAMVSGDLNDNRPLFAVLALAPVLIVPRLMPRSQEAGLSGKLLSPNHSLHN